MGIPFWELPYGYYNFQRLCRAEIGLQVFEKIPQQEIVCADYPYVTFHKELLKSGFTTVEVRGKAGEIKKYSTRPDGGIDETAQERLASNYCLTFLNNNQLTWRVWRHDQLITGARDGHVVARQSRFSWAGMWWQEEARPVLGRGGDCSDEKNRSIVAVRYGAS